MVKIAQTTNLKQTWRENRDISEVAYLTFLKRVKAGMSIEQALTSENKQYKPSTPMGEYWAENKNRAKVSYNTYRQRVAKGMTFEEAISEENYWKTVSSDEYKKWAKVGKENGICTNTFYHRVHIYGWNHERAATEPVRDKMTKKKIGEVEVTKESDREVKEMVIALLNANLPVPKKYIKRFPELFEGGA